MQSRSNFWLTLHTLVTDLELEGETDFERVKNVLQVVDSLPPVTKAVYLKNLTIVASTLKLLAAASTLEGLATDSSPDDS